MQLRFTWDRIDAHDTGGVAEQIVEELNFGISEKTVASIHGVSLATVQYICVHEEYAVLSAEKRAFVRLERHKMERTLRQAGTLITKIGREARRAERVRSLSRVEQA